MSALREFTSRRAQLSSDSEVLPTPREKQIIELLIQRKKNKEIATSLGLSAGTVKMHIYRMFLKFNVKKRRELADRFRGSV